MNRPINKIFTKVKAEMYKKLDELRQEYEHTVDEHITLNVLDFDDLHSVNRNDYADYDLGYIYTSNYFKVKMIVQSISLKISIQVELNTKYMKGTWSKYAYDLVNISKEEYNKIYVEIKLKEAKQVVKNELRKEGSVFNIFTKIFKNKKEDKILKICAIADRRLIEFTLENGDIDLKRGLKIKFNKTMKLNGIENIEYVEVGNDYIYAWVSTQNKYIFLNM